MSINSTCPIYIHDCVVGHFCALDNNSGYDVNGPTAERTPIPIEEIWSEMVDIPDTAPAANSTIVKKVTVLLQSITTRKYHNNEIKQAIPATYSKGAYAPFIVDSEGTKISYNRNVWILDSRLKIVEFKTIVNLKNPLSLTYWQYTGALVVTGGTTTVLPKDNILLFVDDLGLDSNSGLVESLPLQTLTKAFDIIADTGWNETAIVKIVNKVSLPLSITLYAGIKGTQKNPVCITGNVVISKLVPITEIRPVIDTKIPFDSQIMEHYTILSEYFTTDDIGSFIRVLLNEGFYEFFISEVKIDNDLNLKMAYVNKPRNANPVISQPQNRVIFKNTSSLYFDNTTINFQSPVTISNLNIEAIDFNYTTSLNRHKNYLVFTGQQEIKLSGLNFNIKKLNRALTSLNTILYNDIQINNVDCVITTGSSRLPLENMFTNSESRLGIAVISEIMGEYDSINFHFNSSHGASTNLYNSISHMRRVTIPQYSDESINNFEPTFTNCDLGLFSAYGPYIVEFKNINMAILDNIYFNSNSSSLNNNLIFDGNFSIENSVITYESIEIYAGGSIYISKSQVNFNSGLAVLEKFNGLYISNVSKVLFNGRIVAHNHNQSKYAVSIHNSDVYFDILKVYNTVENNSNGLYLNNSTLLFNSFSIVDNPEFTNNVKISSQPLKPLINALVIENGSTVTCKKMTMQLSIDNPTIEIKGFNSQLNVSNVLNFYYNTSCTYNNYCAVRLADSASLTAQTLNINGESIDPNPNPNALPPKPNGIFIINNCTFNVTNLNLDKLLGGIATSSNIISLDNPTDLGSIITIGTLTATNIYGIAIATISSNVTISKLILYNCFTGIFSSGGNYIINSFTFEWGNVLNQTVATFFAANISAIKNIKIFGGGDFNQDTGINDDLNGGTLNGRNLNGITLSNNCHCVIGANTISSLLIKDCRNANRRSTGIIVNDKSSVVLLSNITFEHCDRGITVLYYSKINTNDIILKNCFYRGLGAINSECKFKNVTITDCQLGLEFTGGTSSINAYKFTWGIPQIQTVGTLNNGHNATITVLTVNGGNNGATLPTGKVANGLRLQKLSSLTIINTEPSTITDCRVESSLDLPSYAIAAELQSNIKIFAQLSISYCDNGILITDNSSWVSSVLINIDNIISPQGAAITATDSNVNFNNINITNCGSGIYFTGSTSIINDFRFKWAPSILNQLVGMINNSEVIIKGLTVDGGGLNNVDLNGADLDGRTLNGLSLQENSICIFGGLQQHCIIQDCRTSSGQASNGITLNSRSSLTLYSDLNISHCDNAIALSQSSIISTNAITTDSCINSLSALDSSDMQIRNITINNMKTGNLNVGIKMTSSTLKSKTITINQGESPIYSIQAYDSIINVEKTILQSRIDLKNTNCVFKTLHIACENSTPNVVMDAGSLTVCRFSSCKISNTGAILGSTNANEIEINNGIFNIITDDTTPPWVSVLGGITLTNAAINAASPTRMIIYIGGSKTAMGVLESNDIISPIDLKDNWEFTTATADKTCLTAINSSINATFLESEFAGGGNASMSLNNSNVKFNGGFTSHAYSDQTSHIIISNNSLYEDYGSNYEGNTDTGIDINFSKCVLNSGTYSGNAESAFKCNMLSDIRLLDYNIQTSSMTCAFNINNGSTAKLSNVEPLLSNSILTALSILKGSSAICVNNNLPGSIVIGGDTYINGFNDVGVHTIIEGCTLIKLT